MIEHIHRPHREAHVALGVDVVERHPPRLFFILHVHFLVEHHQHLGERHQTLPPHRVHHLVRLTGILLVNRHEHEVMKYPLGRHVIIHDLGNRHLEERQEDPLRGMSEVVILHRGLADDCRRIHRRLSHRHRGHVHQRIEIRLGVESGVVTERAFHHQFFGRVYVALNDELGFRRHLEVARQRLRQYHRLMSQKSGENEFVNGWR